MENNNSLTEPSSSKPRLKLDFSTASSKINIKKDVQYPLKDDFSRHKEVKTITHAKQEYKLSQHAKMRKMDSITHDQESKQSNLDVHIPSSEKKLKDNDYPPYTNENNNSSRLSDECKLKRKSSGSEQKLSQKRSRYAYETKSRVISELPKSNDIGCPESDSNSTFRVPNIIERVLAEPVCERNIENYSNPSSLRPIVNLSESLLTWKSWLHKVRWNAEDYLHLFS